MTALREREAERAAIERALAAARDGIGGLLLLEGAAGIGKTELLREARTNGTELTVLSARASALEQEFAFGVCLQLFESAVARLNDEAREDVLAGAAAPARSLLAGDVDPAPPEDRLFANLHALYWVCSNLAERTPVILVVDDLHWADPPSLRFLLYLAQRLEGLSLALLAAYRPGEPGTETELLEQLAVLGTVLRPQSLTPGAVADVVREGNAGADDEFCGACAEVTGGNPFLLRELLRALEDEGVESTRASVARVAELTPEPVLRAMLARLSRFPRTVAVLAQAVAVLGDDVESGDAAAVAQLSLDDAAAAADALRAAGILDDDARLSFAHPLLRAAVYTDVPEGERAVLHLRAARVVADDTRAAIHLLKAPLTRDRNGVATLRSAAERALAAGAPDLAARYLARALAEADEDTQLRVQLLIELAEAEVLAGDPTAFSRLETAVSLAEDARTRARILLRLAWMLHKAAQFVEAADALERGLSLLGDEDDDLKLELQVAYLGIGWYDDTRAADVAARRLSLMRELEGTPASSGVAAQAILHAFFTGESAADVRANAVTLLGGGGLAAHERGPDSLSYWIAVGCLAWSDELDAADEAIAAASDDAVRSGSVLLTALCAYARSWPRLWRGQVAEAAADAQLAVDAWRGGWGMYLPAAMYWLAAAHLERGEVDAARESVQLPGEQQWRGTPIHALWVAANGRIAAAAGDNKTAYELLTSAGSALTSLLTPNPAGLPWRSEAALAAAGLGETDEARRLASEEVDLARRFGAARPLGIALRAAGLVEGGEPGVSYLREAVSVLEQSPSQLELARALVDLGGVLRRGNHRREAREPLRRGLDMATRFGAYALERRAVDELAASGAQIRRTAQSGRNALTPSELRVCHLAADGKSNREIAQGLFVTVAAVKWHLRNAYTKLGINGRDELEPALAAEPSEAMADLRP